MTRVQTQYKGDAMLFIKRDGAKALHPYEFNHNGMDFYLLGGVYYDLEQDLIDRIFGE
jgi:hypothetical protein